MEYLKVILIVYGIEAVVASALLLWCRFCDRKYSRVEKCIKDLK